LKLALALAPGATGPDVLSVTTRDSSADRLVGSSVVDFSFCITLSFY
jgi:hypothetical protein